MPEFCVYKTALTENSRSFIIDGSYDDGIRTFLISITDEQLLLLKLKYDIGYSESLNGYYIKNCGDGGGLAPDADALQFLFG